MIIIWQSTDNQIIITPINQQKYFIRILKLRQHLKLMNPLTNPRKRLIRTIVHLNEKKYMMMKT